MSIRIIRLWGVFLPLLFIAGCSNQNQDEAKPDPAVAVEKKIVIQDLCWSPDNRTLFFSAMKVKPDFSDYSPQLWTVYRFDSQTTRTERVAESALNVAVSPLGEKLAVSKNIEGRRNVYLLDQDGSNPTALITGDAKISAPSWSPDGEQIAFMSTASGTEEIYIANRDGTNLRRLTHSDGHNAYNPAWSPDGKHIGYYLEKGDGQDQIHVINVDGTEDRNITNDSFNNIFPGWIDEDTLIYGQGHKNAPTKTYQIDIDGNDKKQVLQLESMYARYSPDGSKIAYINEVEGMVEIISSAGKRVEQVAVPD